MEDFSKVRSRIAGLKKEKEELARNYGFLAEEIKRIVDEHGNAIQELSKKTEEFSSRLAKSEEKESASQASIESVKEALSNEISELEKRLEEQGKSLAQFSSQLAKAAKAASDASEGIKQSQKTDKGFSGALNNISERLEGLSKHIDGLEGRVDSSVNTVDNKFTSGISLVNRTLDEQVSLLKDHDSAINRLALSLQTLKKDIEAENERMKRVRESTAENRKKLELLGKLEAKIKHIEQVKAGLVKGVESLKSIENKMAALQQKTLDLDKKLTGADKFIEEKLVEKTDVLERHLEDRLKILETGIVQRNNDMFSRIGTDISGLKKDLSSLRSVHAETRKKIKLIDGLKQRITDIEKLSKSLMKDLQEIGTIKKDITALRKDVDSNRIRMEDVDSAIDKKIDFNVSSIKKDTAFNAAALARLDEELRKTTLDLNAMKKDTKGTARTAAKLSSDISQMQKKLSELEKIQIKLGDLSETKQSLTDAMEDKLQERIKFMESTLKQRADNIEASLNDRLKKVIKDKDEISRGLSSMKGMKTDMARMAERSKSFEKQFGEFKTQVFSELSALTGKIDSTKTEEGNKFSTAVKAFLNSRAELNKKISMLELRVSDSNKRVSDFSKVVSRLDLLERKVDRLSERNAEIRRDMDSLERKGTGDEKVTVVDLGSAENLGD
ncbi:MAG: hypothetical protein J7K54_04530 [Candidatus Aenigmarchaeota archaeon]|nr:hypothetical protein [Candidatus Aenigmarchaeota archaeon]